MTKLDETLMAAGKASQKLAVLDDQLRDAIQSIETSLRKHLSVRVSTRFSEKYALTFGKIDGKWRLIMTSIEGGDEIDEVLERMSRELRSEVLSGGHIERLLSESLGIIDGRIADRQYAIQKACALLEALEGKAP